MLICHFGNTFLTSIIIIRNEKHKEFMIKVKYYLENRDNIVKLQRDIWGGTDQPILNFFVQVKILIRNFYHINGTS